MRVGDGVDWCILSFNTVEQHLGRSSRCAGLDFGRELLRSDAGIFLDDAIANRMSATALSAFMRLEAVVSRPRELGAR
mgnify:CR=1 FL=1